MSQTVGAYVLERLSEWGVEKVFGYPGDGINGILGGWHEAENAPEFIQCRHEEIAAFAATAYAKMSGRVGVCLATSGPGAIHLLNGLYDAKLDHAPVVAIVGQQARMSIGGHYQQEVDLDALFKDVAHEYVHECNAPQQARQLIDRAIRIAHAERTVTCVIFPNDVQESPWEEPPREHGALFAGVGLTDPRVLPKDEDLQRAADVLNAGEKVAMLVGQGAKDATDEVIQLAEVLGAGVAKALNGRAVVPDELPFVTGSIGLLGTKPTYEMIENCDTLLMIGSSFPYSEWLPPEGQARAVQIDIDAKMIGIRYPMEVNLVGDAAETIRALLPLLERKADRSWREEIESNVDRWWEILDEQAHVSANPLNPQLLFHELSSRLPDRCMLTSDSGSATDWWARHLKVRSDMKAALSGTLATMCPAVPYAIGAKFAHPDRPLVACIGDGAFQMLGVNALIDIVRWTPHWENKQTVILVLHNDDLNQVTWEQRVMSGDPKLEVSQELPDFPYARYAELLGIKGIKVDSPDQVAPAWDEAFADGGPVLIEAVTDPEVPPLPPHIRFEQASNLAKALRKGEPNTAEILKQSFKGKLAEFVTR